MNTSSLCLGSFTDVSELFKLSSCSLSTVGDISSRSVSLAICGIIFIAELIILAVKFKAVEDKKLISRIIIYSAVVENIIMSIRPLVGLLTDYRAYNTLWAGLVTHISASCVANLAILFVYFEAGILHASTMSEEEDKFFKYRNVVLLLAAILQTLLFVLGPFLVSYGLLRETVAFWVPVILVDFTVIPYFCILGIIIYVKIRHMESDTYKKLSRQLIIIILCCTGLGIFTGVVGLIACILTYDIQWILIEICWISAILFCGFIFILLSRSKAKTVHVTTGTSSQK